MQIVFFLCLSDRTFNTNPSVAALFGEETDTFPV